VPPPATYSPHDKILILVKGFPLSSTMFGYSGKGSMFVSTGSNADGTILFAPVNGAQDVDLERNSAADFTNRSNYGKNGFVPPGIYFLHYHKLDSALGTLRNRLGLSDSPGSETIRTDIPNPPVTRTYIQFHRAFNNLKEFNANVSEGCITLTADNFSKLFPDALFDQTQSPLAPGSGDPNPLSLSGSPNNVLVFVTDAMTPGKQDKQLALFDKIRRTLKPADFALSPGSQLLTYRIQWK
jgi:hypothetical protein